MKRMGVPDRSAVAFTILGDDLLPAEITHLLGCKPTTACAKGDVRIGSQTADRNVEIRGKWRLVAEKRGPEDISAQILEILGRLNNDLAVWESLATRYSMVFFCGVFMGSPNDVLKFSAELLREIGVRGISLTLDIYDASDD